MAMPFAYHSTIPLRIICPIHLSLQTERIFGVLKAHLKRAPSLKGAALVKLSQLRVQSEIWPKLYNLTEITDALDQVRFDLADDLTLRRAHVGVTGLMP